MMESQRKIRRKYWKPKQNQLCPCGSGMKYKECCWNRLPGFDIGKAYSAACEAERFGRALVAARADVTQYTIWHRTNTEPALQMGAPIEYLLRVDVNALSEYVDRLSWLYFNTGKWKSWPAALECLSSNIRHEWWKKKIIYYRAVLHLAPGGSRSKARQELAKMGPITVAEGDVEILQVFVDLELQDAGLSERVSFFDRIIEIDDSAESQIQYRGAKAINYLLHGDSNAAESQLKSILEEYKYVDGEPILSPYAKQKLLYAQEALGTITHDANLLRQTASELSAELQAEKWTDFGRSSMMRQIGDCYRYALEWELAIGAYEEALNLNGNAICQVHLAECFLYQRKTAEAARQIESVQLNQLEKHEMMDFIFAFSAISIWCERSEMLEKAKQWLRTLETSEPLFDQRRLNLLVRVTETAAKGAATPAAKADSAPEDGIAGAARMFLFQPNFFGIGINFNEIIERLSRSRKDRPLAIEHQKKNDEQSSWGASNVNSYTVSTRLAHTKQSLVAVRHWLRWAQSRPSSSSENRPHAVHGKCHGVASAPPSLMRLPVLPIRP